MKLKDYLPQLSSEEKRLLALRADTTPSYLVQIAHGHRAGSMDLWARLEQASDGKLTRQANRPDLF